MTLDAQREAGVERSDRELQRATHPFAQQSAARSWWHIVQTFGFLLVTLTTAIALPWWPAKLAASLLATLILVRTFILYHDFMHGAMLPTSRLARVIFYIYGCINLTPPRSWRDSHNFHHANVGELEGSNIGSFPIMTTEDWRRAPRSRRASYRIIRHPLTILLAYFTVFFFSVTLLPLLRRPSRYWDSGMSLLLHFGSLAALWYFIGFQAAFFGLWLPVSLAGALGGYLFYSQHSFPDLQVLPQSEWSVYRASLTSSSFLDISPLLHWFTGNIGYHHVHHLNSLIPFHRLPEAMAAIPELQHPFMTTLTPRGILACFRANLWDEASGKMVRYRDVEEYAEALQPVASLSGSS